MTPNYKDKPLTEFSTDQTLYMRKFVNGSPVDILVGFVKFLPNRSEVFGVVIEPDNKIYKSMFPTGNSISAKAVKCFTVSKGPAEGLPVYCFFNKDGTMPTNCKEK